VETEVQRRLTIREIEKETKRLTPEERLELVERLIHGLRMTGTAEGKPLDWNQLYGLGKGLWKGEDAQEYVDRLRY
jgi:hypothetical protein